MKNDKILTLLLSVVFGFATVAIAQPTDAPAKAPPAITAPTVTAPPIPPPDAAQPPASNTAASNLTQVRVTLSEPVIAANGSNAVNAVPATNELSNIATNAERPLHLNFREAPLEMVLKYLSEAAGFIILPETE